MEVTITPDHEYDARLEDRSYRRLYVEERAMAFSSLDCVLNGATAVYASTELTTGARAMRLMEGTACRAVRDLPQSDRDALLRTNIVAARRFAAELRERLGGATPVVTPAPFEAPGWTQAEYLAYWEELIRTRIHAVYFNEGWEYSNGCTFEFAVAAEAGVATFAADGSPLPLADAVRRVEAAVREMEGRGYDAGRLHRNLVRLRKRLGP